MELFIKCLQIYFAMIRNFNFKEIPCSHLIYNYDNLMTFPRSSVLFSFLLLLLFCGVNVLTPKPCPMGKLQAQPTSKVKYNVKYQQQQQQHSINNNKKQTTTILIIDVFYYTIII